MRITSKGQVTIPKELREKTGMLPHTEVEFIYEDGVIKLLPIRAQKGAGRGDAIVGNLSGRATAGLSTEEIMALTRAE
jgi:AbrB family looped-hinge helix DNA binding protein